MKNKSYDTAHAVSLSTQINNLLVQGNIQEATVICKTLLKELTQIPPNKTPRKKKHTEPTRNRLDAL